MARIRTLVLGGVEVDNVELGGRSPEGGEGAPPGNGGRGADVELLVLLGQGHGGDLAAERVRALLALELLYIRLVRRFNVDSIKKVFSL